MGKQAQEHRAAWNAQGFGEQYIDGYFRNTGFDQYPDGSGTQDAWQAATTTGMPMWQAASKSRHNTDRKIRHDGCTQMALRPQLAAIVRSLGSNGYEDLFRLTERKTSEKKE